MVVVVGDLSSHVQFVRKFDILQFLRTPVLRDQAFDMMGGAMRRDHQQVVFVRLVCDARHRSHFREAQRPVRKGLINLR